MRCSPLTDPASSVSPVPWRLKAADLTVAKRLCGCQMQPSQTGGDLCRPLGAVSRARRSVRELWRERPPIWTPSPARPAASEVVAHATLFLPLAGAHRCPTSIKDV